MIKKITLVFVVTLFFFACKKSTNNNQFVPSLGTCTWTLGGATFTANSCSTGPNNFCSGKRNMAAATINGSGIGIKNMPTASSGTFNLVSDCGSPAAGDCDLTMSAVDNSAMASYVYTISGTVTKTGPTTFTFSVVLADDCPGSIINPNPQIVTVTGSGNYVEN